MADDLNTTTHSAVEEGLQFVEATLRSIRTGVLWADLDGRIRGCNEAIQQTLGYAQEELIGKLLRDVFLCEEQQQDGSRLDDLVRELLAKGHHEIEECQFRRKSGEVLLVSLSASLVRDRQGNPMGIVAALHDITERKAAERSLRESEERFRAQYKGMPLPTYTWQWTGDDLTLVDCNDAAEAATRGRIADLIGIKASEMYQDDPEILESLRRCFAERTVTKWEGLYQYRSTGERAHLVITYAFVPPDLVLAHTQDITERKRAEELFRTLADSSPIGIFVVQDRVFRFVNAQFQRYTGYSEDELLGQDPLTLLVHPDDREIIRESAVAMLKGERSPLSPYEYRVITKGGEPRWIMETVASIQYQGRRASAGNYIDISERKRMEDALWQYSQELERLVEERTRSLREAQEKLIRSERLAAIGEMAGGLGHELRNPLAAIKASAYYLKMRLGDADERVQKHLDMLESEVDACNEIITDLLDFSRPGRGTLEDVDVNGLIRRVVSASAVPPDVEVLTLGASPAILRADASQLERIFANLVANAFQAMPDGGRLTISTDERDGFIEVKVADTGVGIPEDNLEKIFEPLFTTKPRSTGLGLAIVQAVIERMGGSIGVESQVDQGTIFHVRLPLAGAETGAAV